MEQPARNDWQPSQDPELREWYPCPPFMPANMSCVRAVKRDPQGRYWAFVDLVHDLIHCSSGSALLRVEGRRIGIGMRAHWVDFDKPPVPAGDVPVYGSANTWWSIPDADDWPRLTGIPRPDDWQGSRKGFYAVPLPFEPEEAYLFD